MYVIEVTLVVVYGSIYTNVDHIYLLDCFVFFFSSRRRHTRFDCDWSSDVCSSDLLEMVRSGATCVVDYVYELAGWTDESIGAVVQAYRDLGLRAVVVIGMSDRA